MHRQAHRQYHHKSNLPEVFISYHSHCAATISLSTAAGAGLASRSSPAGWQARTLFTFAFFCLDKELYEALQSLPTVIKYALLNHRRHGVVVVVVLVPPPQASVAIRACCPISASCLAPNIPASRGTRMWVALRARRNRRSVLVIARTAGASGGHRAGVHLFKHYFRSWLLAIGGVITSPEAEMTG